MTEWLGIKADYPSRTLCLEMGSALCQRTIQELKQVFVVSDPVHDLSLEGREKYHFLVCEFSSWCNEEVNSKMMTQY